MESIISTPLPAMATRSCASGPGWPTTAINSSLRRKPASVPTSRRAMRSTARSIACVPRLDLIQRHNLADPQEWEVAMGPGGALEAVIEAREQGLVRFIGVTGHGPLIAQAHMRSLERFDVDSVLLPCNYVEMQKPQYAREFEEVVTACQQRNVAVQTIKALPRIPWDGGEPTRATWYAPLEEQADIDRAVHWVLGRPDIFLNTAGDIQVLPRILDAASRFEAAPNDDEMRELVA